MPANFSIESVVQDVMNRRDASHQFVGELAVLYGLQGCSQTRISQALRGAKEFSNEQEPLRTLLQDLDAYCESIAPIPVALKNPVLIKQLLDKFLKTREHALIHTVYLIEFADGRLLRAIVNSKPEKTTASTEAAAIQNKETANQAAKLLNAASDWCHPVLVRQRVSEAKMARSLRDLGFTEASNGDRL